MAAIIMFSSDWKMVLYLTRKVLELRTMMRLRNYQYFYQSLSEFYLKHRFQLSILLSLFSFSSEPFISQIHFIQTIISC